MANDRQLFTQELTSARYLVDEPATVEPQPRRPAARTQPRRSGLEPAFRWISPLVVVMLVGAVGGWFWLNQSSLSSSAGRFRQRTSNPVDFMLWLSGSDKTFEDALIEAQKNPAFQLDTTKPAYLDTQFDNVDFENLSSQLYGPGQ